MHESVDARRARPGGSRHELQHFAYRDISDHLATIDRYTTLAAEQMAAPRAAARTASRSAVHPPLAFLRNYILRGGFTDGSAGLLVSALNSYYVFLKFAKLWELPAAAPRQRSGSGSIRPGRTCRTSQPSA